MVEQFSFKSPPTPESCKSRGAWQPGLVATSPLCPAIAKCPAGLNPVAQYLWHCNATGPTSSLSRRTMPKPPLPRLGKPLKAHPQSFTSYPETWSRRKMKHLAALQQVSRGFCSLRHQIGIKWVTRFVIALSAKGGKPVNCRILNHPPPLCPCLQERDLTTRAKQQLFPTIWEKDT